MVEDLVHEIEHYLAFAKSRDFHLKTWTPPKPLVIDATTTRQDVERAKRDYANRPSERIAIANTEKRLQAQKHFKSLREFWDNEILPELEVSDV